MKEKSELSSFLEDAVNEIVEIDKEQTSEWHDLVQGINFANSFVPQLGAIDFFRNDYSSGLCLQDSRGIPYTNFVIKNIRIFYSKGEEDRFEVTIMRSDGYPVRVDSIPISEFRVGNWYRKVSGIFCKNQTLFADYCEDWCGKPNLSRIRLIKRTGWEIDDHGGWHYYTSEGEIVDQSEIVQIADNKGAKIFCPKGVSETETLSLFDGMSNLTHSPTAMIIQRYVLLASLFTIFADCGFRPKGVLMLIGARSTLKTSLAMVLAELVNRTPGMEPAYNFDSTKASIDEASSEYKDCCLIVDDFHPVEDLQSRRGLETTLEHITRIYGQSVAKKRSKKSQWKDVGAPEGLALLTGEYIAGVSSSMTRRLHVEIEKNDVDISKLSFCQRELWILPSFHWYFVRFCEENQKNLKEMIPRCMQQFRNESQSLFSASRYGDFYAQFMTINQIYLEYKQACCCIGSEEFISQSEYFRQALLSVIAVNDNMQNAKNPIEQIRTALIDFFNDCQVPSVNDKVKSDIYVSADFVYVRPEKLLRIVEAYATTQGITSAVKDVAYLSMVLKRENFLETTVESNQIRFTVKIPGSYVKKQNSRFFCIRKEKFILDD